MQYLPSSAPTRFPPGAGRRGTSLLPATAGMPRLPGHPPTRYERGRNQLLQRRTSAVWAGDSPVAPHQYLECYTTIMATILIDRHRASSLPESNNDPRRCRFNNKRHYPPRHRWRVRRPPPTPPRAVCAIPADGRVAAGRRASQRPTARTNAPAVFASSPMLAAATAIPAVSVRGPGR